MTHPKFIAIGCLLILASWAMKTSGQEIRQQIILPDSTPSQILETKDGASWTGRAVRVDRDTLLFQTRFGELRIPQSEIGKIETLSMKSVHEGKIWFPNPNATRLFFAPTARMLKKGEGYFADFYVLFPSVTFGITDQITLGGGISLVPGVDPDDQLFYVTPKVGWTLKKNMDFAAGLLYIQLPEAHSLGIAYGVATFGSEDRSVTAGMGYGYADGDPAKSPIFVLGGESRTSRHIGLVTENWFGADIEGAIVSGGVRFFSQKLSVDLAMMTFLGDANDAVLIPYLDFVYQF
jgi:hypothetical protein